MPAKPGLPNMNLASFLARWRRHLYIFCPQVPRIEIPDRLAVPGRRLLDPPARPAPPAVGERLGRVRRVLRRDGAIGKFEYDVLRPAGAIGGRLQLATVQNRIGGLVTQFLIRIGHLVRRHERPTHGGQPHQSGQGRGQRHHVLQANSFHGTALSFLSLLK